MIQYVSEPSYKHKVSHVKALLTSYLQDHQPNPQSGYSSPKMLPPNLVCVIQ
jgi:hypothetical protein